MERAVFIPPLVSGRFVKVASLRLVQIQVFWPGTFSTASVGPRAISVRIVILHIVTMLSISSSGIASLASLASSG